VYLDERDISLLKTEDDFVRKRYAAVARTLQEVEAFRVTRERAAEMIGRSRRQMQRVVKRFLQEGIPGLRLKSRRPHASPNRTPPDVERRIVRVREATGFGSVQLARIVNVGLSMEGREPVTRATCYRVMARNGLVEAERRAIKEYRRFEWSRPDELIQCDPTSFNGVPILTMEDDHSRSSWAGRLRDQEDGTVVRKMEELHPSLYENLLTDNGGQFSKRNSAMRRYCEERVMGRHIWSSVHHPQTMGKLSAFQKGMKRFLRHRLGRGRDVRAIDECVSTYLSWYNNGFVCSSTGQAPAERYSGRVNEGWYEKLVISLKLEEVLPMSCVGGG
jgi:hypothetical protein